MTRRARIAAISASALVLVLAALVVSAFVVLQSSWLRNEIRQRIVAAAEKATGGKVEIGGFDFDWHSLTAQVNDLTIHGTEPAETAPLLRIPRLAVGLKIISFFERKFDVASVNADSPRAHVIIRADGSTNLPQPATPPRGKTIPETILDLRIKRFNIADGLFIVQREGAAQASVPWSGSGEKLFAQVTYAASRYDAKVAIAPVDVAWGGTKLRARTSFTATMEKNKLFISSANVATGSSEFNFSNVLVNSFASPVTTGRYQARVSLADADRVFKLVNFQHTGEVNVAGDLRFVSPSDYTVNGSVRGAGIGYGKVRNMRVTGDITATPERVALRSLVVNALGGVIRTSGEVHKFDTFQLTGTIQRFDARVLAEVAGIASVPYNGFLSGPFEASGKLQERDLHNLIASATLDVAPAESGIPLHGQVTAKFTGSTTAIELGTSWIELPNTRVDISGTPGQHLDVKLRSRDLSDLSPVLNPRDLPATLPPHSGSVSFEGTVSGPLSVDSTDLRIAGHGAVQNAIYEGQHIDSASGNFTATRSQLTLNDVTVTSGPLRANVSGSAGLAAWKIRPASPIDGNVQLNNADVPTLLRLAGEKSSPIAGTLTTTAHITGTAGDPRASADINLVRGQIYGEPFDSLTGRAQYSTSGEQSLTATITAGRKRANATLKLDPSQRLTFNISTNTIAINDLSFARKIEPSLRGTAQVKADGIARLAAGKTPEVEELNADISATGLRLENRALGNAHVVATTKAGILSARIDSDFARSNVRGEGTVRLGGDYPVDAKLTFSNFGAGAMLALARGPGGASADDLNLDGSATGDVSLKGSGKALDSLTATLQITQFELHPLRVTGDARNIANLALRNDGPVRASLFKSNIRVENARFTAPSTDLSMTGGIALSAPSPLDLAVRGNVNLALAETFNADLTSAGQVSVNATIRGSFTSPDISGRAELKRGDFHVSNFSNGLTNANGIILFSGSRATIQSLSAETGGGKVDITGFAARTAGLNSFRLQTKTIGVRLRYPEGVSTISDSTITLAGTSQRSEVSGLVTVRRVSINPKSDISTIIANAAQPLKSPEASNELLTNMHLDVQVETAPDVAFETSVARRVEADANLRVRGTAASPAVLGRINVTQGEIVFFGNKYTINQGTISFFNPARIDPILNVDLETKARGVDVVITVTGPMNKLNVSYRSDPPLQFSDIVALLATGRTPTDPTLAIRDTGQSQSLQQIGASALLGQAIANPVAGRLQRFFGVSRIKIDPQLTGITGSPEARLTVEQQIAPDLLFTYITDVSSTSTQLFRVQWDFDRQWAAVLTREENGYVGVDFVYKKRFK
jgi:translocation and assembly module TamB